MSKWAVIMNVTKFMIHIFLYIFKSFYFKTSFLSHLPKLPIDVLIDHLWRFIEDWTFKTLETVKASEERVKIVKSSKVTREVEHVFQTSVSFSFYP